MGTTTTNYNLYKPDIGETGWGDDVNTSTDTVDSTMKANEDAIALNTTHRGSDGTDHANVVLNDSHRTGDGSDHADVATNTTHSTGDGSDHADVASNTTHRTSDGSDHTFIDQSVISGASPTFDGANITGVDAANVDIADAGGYITATDVEGALQENRPLIDANTAHAALAAPHREINDAGTAATDLWSAQKISSVVQGIDWKESVIDFYDPTGGLPGGPSTGDRYIASATANGWTDTYIYEYNGATWDEDIPNEGAAAWNETDDTNYTFNGTSWVKFGSTVDHVNLQNIGTNTHAQIDTHISGTGADHTYIDQSVVSGASPTFDGANFTGVDAANVDIADAGGYITATDVEGALQEHRPLINSALVAVVNFVIDGGGSAITTGIKGDIEIPFACTINQVTLLADQSTTTTIDIWKDTYANYPADDSDSITAAAVPTITAALKSQDSTLTGWTTSVSTGDCLRFNVDANDNATRVTISLKVTKT